MDNSLRDGAATGHLFIEALLFRLSLEQLEDHRQQPEDSRYNDTESTIPLA